MCTILTEITKNKYYFLQLEKFKVKKNSLTAEKVFEREVSFSHIGCNDFIEE